MLGGQSTSVAQLSAWLVIVDEACLPLPRMHLLAPLGPPARTGSERGVPASRTPPPSSPPAAIDNDANLRSTPRRRRGSALPMGSPRRSHRSEGATTATFDDDGQEAPDGLASPAPRIQVQTTGSRGYPSIIIDDDCVRTGPRRTQ
ncbi:uncharacterized protein PSFLO_03521 [Pseudozyma flocculosa]|uniref:Uncharacterized protein n=1 Tax=Pseudozyma flocculosa TaxID=84751 RepID=A0A5C3F0J9_9BASI|nr:uncharacterized protein PSFLO_03521 [Pseudozyma flocculosa]